MTRALEVHVNRSDHHDVETRTRRFAPEGPFEVHVQNHGDGLHVHLSVTGDLALQSAQIEGNPYLEPDATLAVPVDVPTELRPASGTVEVSTGYGRNGVSVDVDVVGDGSAPPRDDGSASGRDEGSSDRAGTRSANASSVSPQSGTPGASTGSAPSSTRGGATTAASTAALEPLARVPAALVAGASRAASRLSSVASSSRSTADDRDDVERSVSVPTFDAGTIFLTALALLAVGAAGAALSLLSGPVVALGVLAVLLTVLGVGVYLLSV